MNWLRHDFSPAFCLLHELNCNQRAEGTIHAEAIHESIGFRFVRPQGCNSSRVLRKDNTHMGVPIRDYKKIKNILTGTPASEYYKESSNFSSSLCVLSLFSLKNFL